MGGRSSWRGELGLEGERGGGCGWGGMRRLVMVVEVVVYFDEF